jgi:hypothetical protein
VFTKDGLKEKPPRVSNSYRNTLFKPKRQNFWTMIDKIKKSNVSKVEVFMNHIKNNMAIFTKPINIKPKIKQKKRPSSSDMRKNKKSSTHKLLENDSMKHDLKTPNSFYNTI